MAYQTIISKSNRNAGGYTSALLKLATGIDLASLRLRGLLNQVDIDTPGLTVQLVVEGATDPDGLQWILLVGGPWESGYTPRPGTVRQPPGHGWTHDPPIRLYWIRTQLNINQRVSIGAEVEYNLG